MRRDELLLEMLGNRLGTHDGLWVDVDVRVEDADEARLFDESRAAAYWYGQCPGRHYQHSTDANVLARLCQRPPNRSMLRSCCIKDDGIEPKVSLEYVVWRE